MIKVIHCTVNGKVREIAVDERESLTDMLRLRLGLTSVKKGCEAGECGACTVLIDGVAKNSCILLAVWGVCFHPGVLVVHWHGLGNGDFRADGWMQSLLIFPLLLALECFTLNLWRLFQQTGYFRHWGESDTVLTNSLDLLSPGVRLVKFALDYFFFFCCGLTVPFCEFLLIVMN